MSVCNFVIYTLHKFAGITIEPFEKKYDKTSSLGHQLPFNHI